MTPDTIPVCTLERGIDCSVRYLPPEQFRNLAQRHRWPIDPGRSFVDCLFEAMARNNVSKAVLVDDIGCEVGNNNVLIEFQRQHPDSLLAVPTLNPRRSEARRNLDAMAKAGVTAVRLTPLNVSSDPLASFRLRDLPVHRIWGDCAQLGLVVFARSTVLDAHILANLATAFPEVRVVIEASMVSLSADRLTHDQWGRPRLNLPLPSVDRFALWGLAECANVSVVLAGQYSFSRCDWPYVDLRDWHGVKNMLSLFGADRLMVGSDFPYTLLVPGYAKSIAHICHAGSRITRNILDSVSYGTAKRLLFATR